MTEKGTIGLHLFFVGSVLSEVDNDHGGVDTGMFDLDSVYPGIFDGTENCSDQPVHKRNRLSSGFLFSCDLIVPCYSCVECVPHIGSCNKFSSPGVVDSLCNCGMGVCSLSFGDLVG